MEKIIRHGLSIFLLLCGSAAAQDPWPVKRISFVVGFSVGGFADNVARLIGNRLGQSLKQSVIIQNLDGAGGNTAARQISASSPDGYTFLVTTTSLAINETLYKNKGFSASQLLPVAIPVSAPEALTGNPKAGLKTFADVVAASREGRLFMGSPGIGSGSHIAAEYFFKKLAKMEVKHIPFAGGNPSMQALLTGDINLRAATVTNTTIPHVRGGELVGIAIASEERDAALPDVPTFAEIGYPGFVANSWVGFFGRAGTPDYIVKKLNDEINAAFDDPEVKKQMESLSLNITKRDLAGTQAYFLREVGNWADMVAATGLQM